MRTIKLPPAMAEFCKAYAALKAHYVDGGLTFTLDGKLIGDIAA